MKVILINGSPHEAGCTYTALAEVALSLSENGIDTEIIWIARGDMSGCTACGYCHRTGSGCIKKDIVNEVSAKLAEADGLIVGTPVYYSSASGQITSFMDRLFYSSAKSLYRKPAAAVVSCRRSGSTATFDQINKYFSINNMPIVSSDYWNAVHGNTPDEVKCDLEGLQTMRQLGQNMAWLLRCISAGRESGISPPIYEKRLSTNFIR